MFDLIKFELQKILKNRTILGGICVGFFLLAGIFWVGYVKSQYQSAAENNAQHGYSRVIEKKYTGDFTDEKIRLTIADYLADFQKAELDNPDRGQTNAWTFHPFYLLNWQVNQLFIKGNNELYLKMKSRMDQGSVLTVDDLKLRTIKDLRFREFGKPLTIGDYAAWSDFYKVQGNIYVLLAVLVILICSVTFSDDKAKNINQILFSTRYGHSKLLSAKIASAAILTLSVFILFQAINAAFFTSIYHVGGWNSSIQTNLDLGLFAFPLEWNHLQIALWLLGIQLLGLLFVAGSSIFISALASTPFTALSGGLGLYVLPALLKEVFREGSLNQFLYLFPVNQQDPGKLLSLLSLEKSFFLSDFIANSFLVAGFLLLCALLMKFLSYQYIRKWAGA